MKRLVIAVDCDDVLVSTTQYFIDAYNKAHGTSIPIDKAHDESHESWEADRELQVARLDALMRTEEFSKLGPGPAEAKIIREISKKHALHLVTARKEEEHELTQAMIERDLPEVFMSLDFVGWTGSKGEVCKRIGADVLIDDSVRHLNDAIKNGLPKHGAILFGNYEWNKNSDVDNDLKRCHSWDEVLEYINELSQ